VAASTEPAPARRRRALRDILLYGVSGGLLIAVLKVTEYRFLVVEHSVDGAEHGQLARRSLGDRVDRNASGPASRSIGYRGHHLGHLDQALPGLLRNQRSWLRCGPDSYRAVPEHDVAFAADDRALRSLFRPDGQHVLLDVVKRLVGRDEAVIVVVGGAREETLYECRREDRADHLGLVAGLALERVLGRP